MIRTSTYTIYVPLPDDPDDELLVHGYTGAFDLVSKEVADHLRKLQNGGAGRHGDPRRKPTEPSDDTLSRLTRRGYLTAKTREEEEEFFTRLVAVRHREIERSRLSYVVMPTYACNLRCTYCFQDSIRWGRPESPRLAVMKPEMIDRIVSAWQAIEERHEVKEPEPRSIILFGGEPLLPRQRNLVEAMVRAFRGAGAAKIGAVTNATGLHHFEHLLGPEGISWLQITLDGPPDEHDGRRIYPDGRGSFGRIAANIDLALAAGAHVSVRVNVDQENLSRLHEVMEIIASRGWSDQERFYAYGSAIHEAEGANGSVQTLGTLQLSATLDDLAARLPRSGRIHPPDHRTRDRIRRLFDDRSEPFSMFRSSYCGAHTVMYVFDPLGHVYRCWERTGDPALRTASILEDGGLRWHKKVQGQWRGRTVAAIPRCRSCPYAFYCGGGCAILAENETGELLSSFCDGFASRFETTVVEAYRQHRLGTAPNGVAPEEACAL